MATTWNANSCMTWYILELEIRRERGRKSRSSVAMAVKLKENTLINPREFLGSCSEKLKLWNLVIFIHCWVWVKDLGQRRKRGKEVHYRNQMLKTDKGWPVPRCWNLTPPPSKRWHSPLEPLRPSRRGRDTILALHFSFGLPCRMALED